MPQLDGFGAGPGQGVHRVAIAVAAGEDDDADADRHACRSPAVAGGGESTVVDDAPAIDSMAYASIKRVGEQLACETLDDGARGGLVGRVDRQLDPPADAHRADPADPEVVEAALDGPPLRIEDARLGRDIDGVSVGAHRAMTSSARYRSKLAPVIRSNASM